MTQSNQCCKDILIIEDDTEIRSALLELLEWEGYRARGASNGKEGLALLPEMEPPCLILLDLMMPVMNGWEFLKVKAGSIKVAPIPVVIISALDDASKAPSGAVKFIKKPIQIDTLIQVVRDYCGVPLK